MAELGEPTRFHLQEVGTRVGPLALVTMDNGEDWQKPNVFGRAALRSLDDLLPRLREEQLERPRSDRQAVRLRGRCRPDGVPADVDPGRSRGRPPSPGTTPSERSARCRCPTLAAINGAAVGGGLEIALHCDYRTIARSVRHIGFPEVFLGIIPGWGGTQLAPRLIGAAAAVELIVANPLKQNRLDRRRAGRPSSGLPTRSSTTSSSSTIRSSGSSARSRGRRAPRRRADLSDAAEVCREGALRRRRRRPRRRARAVSCPRADRRRGQRGRSTRGTRPRRTRSRTSCPARRPRRPCTRST